MTPSPGKHHNDARPTQDFEPHIDRLLTVLGSVGTDSGFEQRILQGATRRLEAHAGSSRGPRFQFRLRRLALPFAAALAVAAAVVFVHLGRTAPPPSVAGRTQVPLDRPALGPTARASLHVAARIQTPSQVHRTAVAQTTEVQETPSSTALASFPAPPLPLTEQERLMLQIIHKGDPEEIAMLNPDFRESLLARDQAEFKEFFPPPPPPPEPDPVPIPESPKGASK